MTGPYTPPTTPWTPPGEWADRAACREPGAVVYFDVWQGGGTGGAIRKSRAERDAKAICEACPVILQCRTWISDNERGRAKYDRLDGIVAGQTPDERAIDRKGRNRKPIAHGTAAGHEQHYRRGEPACIDCLDAYNAHKRERSERRAAAAREARRSA